MSDSSITEFHYAMPGCVDGCHHCLPDTQELQENIDTTGERYTVLVITPHCAQSSERAKFRVTIYQAANAAADKADSACKTVYGKVRARKRIWEQITKPWVQGPCPFFESD